MVVVVEPFNSSCRVDVPFSSPCKSFPKMGGGGPSSLPLYNDLVSVLLH